MSTPSSVLALLLSTAIAAIAPDADPGMPGVLVKDEGSQAGGWPLQESGPAGIGIRYLPNRRFGIGFLLRNPGGVPVTVEDVVSDDPPGSLVRQIGTRLVAVEDPPRCERCVAGHLFLRAPYRSGRTPPLTIAPGGAIGVQLNYEVRGCTGARSASLRSADRLVVRFRIASGDLQEQGLPVGSVKLRLRAPEQWICDPRRRSHLTVGGPYAAALESRIPSADGDACSAHGALSFRSRSYAHMADAKPAVRVLIRLPERHVGVFRQRSGQRPLVLVLAGFGARGWTAFASRSATVRVERLSRARAEGAARAVVGRRGYPPFAVRGIWRCEIP